MLHMLGVDIGDDGDGGGQAVETAVAFIRLNHHPVALPHARVGAVSVDDAAVDDGGVNAARDQQFCDQRGGRRLAMGPRHRDVGLEPHQLGQHLGPADDGQATATGLV